MTKNKEELLSDLARANSPADANVAIESLIADHGFQWRPVGDNQANYGLINIGSDPGLAFIERITNALDAVVEREALRQGVTGQMPTTPREAVEIWFGLPGGRIANLDTDRRQSLADNITISIRDGSSKRRPTLVVRDLGVGLTANMIPKSILSLAQSNKIDKRFLAGAYGQGGSTCLAFSPDGTRIVSRRQPDLAADSEDSCAVTFARYSELDPAINKNGRYDYLVDAAREVASVSPLLLDDFAPGTEITHFDLDFARYSAMMTQPTGSLWWLVQNALFDPILPLWLSEERENHTKKKNRPGRRSIIGNLSRLRDDPNKLVEHANSVTARVEADGETSMVRANYWVLHPTDDGKSRIDNYVDPKRPVIYTFNGQTHGSDPKSLVAERIQLPHLAKDLIIHIELEYLGPRTRRGLLSSTRDRLKETHALDEIRESIAAALAQDEELIRLNDARRERLLSRHSEKERQRVRERFAKLLERFQAGADAVGPGKGDEDGGRPTDTPTKKTRLEPLPTVDEPTFVRIANAHRPIDVRVDRSAVIRLETDAPDGYLEQHVRSRLTIACEPKGELLLQSWSDFSGGRSRLIVRPRDGSVPDTLGRLTVFLLAHTDDTLSDTAQFRILAPPAEETAGDESHSNIKVPEPIPVTQEEWPTLGWDETSVAEVVKEPQGYKIFVNMDNRYIAKLLRKGQYQETGISRMKGNYLLYIGLYSWLEYSQRDRDSSDTSRESNPTAELDRVAQTIVHSIAAEGRLDDD